MATILLSGDTTRHPAMRHEVRGQRLATGFWFALGHGIGLGGCETLTRYPYDL